MMTAPAKRAMILAAGLGQRMRPLTDRCPKPLIEVAGRRLIDYALDTVCDAGIEQVVVNTHYLAEQMRDYIATCSRLKVVESYESQRLETGGGIAHALALLDDAPFFVLNSDTIYLSTPDMPVLTRMAAGWDKEAMDLMLLLYPVNRAIGYEGAGDFVYNKQTGRYRRRRDDEQGDYVFTGVQLLHPKIFKDCPQGAFSMNAIYNRYQSDEGWFERIGFMVHEGDWLHVGDPKGLEQAAAFLNQRLGNAS